MNNNPSIEFLEKNFSLDCSETESIEVYVPPESQADSPFSRRSEMSPVSYESILICKDIDFEDELNKAQDDEEEDAFKILSISFYDRKQSFKSINLMSCDHSPKKYEDFDLTPGKGQNLLANSKRETRPNPQQKYFQYYNLTSVNKPKAKGSTATTATTSIQNLGPKHSSTLFSIRESLNNAPLMHYETNPEVTIQTERGSRTKAMFEERINTEPNSVNLIKPLSLSPRPNHDKLPSPQTPEKQKNSIKPLGTEMKIKEKILFRRTLFQDLPTNSSTPKEMTKSALSDRNLRNSPRGLVTKLKLDEGYRPSKPEPTKDKTNSKFRKPEDTEGPTPPSLSRNALLQIIEAKRATLSHIDASKVQQVFSEPKYYYFNTETPRRQEKTQPIPQLRKLEMQTETKYKVPWKRLTPRESNQGPLKFSPRNPQENLQKGKINFKQKNLVKFLSKYSDHNI